MLSLARHYDKLYTTINVFFYLKMHLNVLGSQSPLRPAGELTALALTP